MIARLACSGYALAITARVTEGSATLDVRRADGSGTRMTVVMRYQDAAARATAIEQGFTDGIAEVYGRIEQVGFAA